MTKTNNSLLELSEVSITIPDVNGIRTLAQGVNLQLASGQIIPIIGPSGCGKSTLLRIIVRLAPLHDGEIKIGCKSISDCSILFLRHNCVYLHQHPVMFPGSVEHNLTLPFNFRANRSALPDRAKTTAALDAVGLNENMLQTNATSISGGEAQRVALARAMLLNPPVLLLDEPTAALDPDSSEIIIATIKHWVSEGGRGVIWVVHERDVLGKLGFEPKALTPEGLVQIGDGGRHDR